MESLERVERSNRDLDAFAGRVAHDLRNALVPIAFATELFRRVTPSSDKVEPLCARLDRARERAMTIVDSLLAFSRVSRSADTHAVARLKDVLDDVLDELAPQIAQVDADVGRAVVDAIVQVPPGLLHVVLANVVGNAVKYVRDRPLRLVRITSRVVRGGCEVRIEDSGPGIPEDARGHIFEPFFRVPGTAAPGTGIGLATVRRIVDAHGGRITVASAEAKGSSFCIWLPLAPEAATEHGLESHEGIESPARTTH
jgi:signal transduction histidine kinase